MHRSTTHAILVYCRSFGTSHRGYIASQRVAGPYCVGRTFGIYSIQSKAYIPLQCKSIFVGSLRWLRPPTRNFALAIPTCWYLKTLKFVLPFGTQRNLYSTDLRWVSNANFSSFWLQFLWHSYGKLNNDFVKD